MLFIIIMKTELGKWRQRTGRSGDRGRARRASGGRSARRANGSARPAGDVHIAESVGVPGGDDHETHDSLGTGAFKVL
jgi:hypothetical protein